MKKQNGITLIALVISIIVMLILAGVSINAVVGDNGVIGKAQDTLYLQSCAVLEEYFNQLYATCAIEGTVEGETALDTIVNSGYQNYFFRTSEGYCLKKSIKNEETGVYENLVFYLIKKDQLPVEVKNQLNAGNATKNLDFRKLRDVYGITSDLKVYYMSSGIDTILGKTKDDLNADNPDIVAYEKESVLAQMVNGGTEAITNQGLKIIKSLTIDSIEELELVKNFSQFPNLTTVYFKNLSIDTLEGIDGALNINYLKFTDCEVQNYSSLNGLANLTYLYLVRPVGKDAEIVRLGSSEQGIASAEFSKLNYFGIVGNDYYLQSTNTAYHSTNYDYGITDISPINNFTQTTKEAIKYVYLQNMQLTSIAALEDFKNVYFLRAEFNRLRTLEGIQNMSNLHYLYVPVQASTGNTWNGLGMNETTEASANDALSYIYKDENGKNNSLHTVNLSSNTALKHIEYLSTCTNIRALYLSGCGSLLNISNISNIFSQCGTSYNVDGKYGTSLISETSKVLKLSGTITTSQFEILMNNTNLTHLALQNLVIKTDAGITLSQTTTPTYDEEITKVLSTCINLQHLQLYNLTNLTSLGFVGEGKVTKLIELDLRSSNNLNDLTNLNTYGTNVRTLTLTNSNIDLTTIQPTIDRCRVTGGYWYTQHGINLRNWNLIKQLENCTEIKHLYNWDMQTAEVVGKTLDLTNTKIEYSHTAGYLMDVKYPSTLKWIFVHRGCVPIISENSTNLTYVYIETPHEPNYNTDEDWEEFMRQLGTCSNLQELKVCTAMHFKFSQLENLSGLTNLKTFTYSGSTNTSIPNDDSGKISLQGIGNLKSVETIIITSLKNLRDLGDLGECLNLNYLKVVDTNVSNINCLSNLSNLETLIMNNNAIKDVYSLLNCKKLTSVNLSNNLLSDMAYHNTENGSMGYDTLDVFYSLNNKLDVSETLDGISGKLSNLDISGNNFTDTDIITSLEWENGLNL